MESSSPAMSVAIAVMAALLGLTGLGVYTAFGPPSKNLDDPFDDHEDCTFSSTNVMSSPGCTSQKVFLSLNLAQLSLQSLPGHQR